VFYPYLDGKVNENAILSLEERYDQMNYNENDGSTAEKFQKQGL